MPRFVYRFRCLAIIVMAAVSGNLLSQDIPSFPVGTGQASVIKQRIPCWKFSEVEECLAQQSCQSPCSYFDRAVDFDVTISCDLEFEVSRNAYNVLVSQMGVASSIRMPDGLLQFRRTTIARWPGKISPFCHSDLIMEESTVLASYRPPYDHFEVVWNGDGFELLQFRDLDRRIRKFQPRPPAVLTETVKLHAVVLDSAIILSPTKMRGLMPLSIVVDFNGIVTTTAVPSVPQLFEFKRRVGEEE